MNQCSCPIAQYCDRHKMVKNHHWHKLCQTRDDYRALWDSGKGPGQGITEVKKPIVITCPNPCEGPGTILHKYLHRIGIRITSTCSCGDHMAQMDRWGPEVCRSKIHIIVGWLREEAKRRKLPFVTTAANLLVKWVIHQSEKSLQNSKTPVDKDSSTS